MTETAAHPVDPDRRLQISPYATAVGEGPEERLTLPAQGGKRRQEQAASQIGPANQAAGRGELGRGTETARPPRDQAGGGGKRQNRSGG